jgi:catechol 2,3-dioxygenase-like lactoylglutathione lyase family enzyme
MPYNVNHIHLKYSDPKKAAQWFQRAFNFKIISETVRPFGDTFVVTEAENGVRVNISSERTNEKLNKGDADAHYGLEHFGFDSADIDADIKRLTGLGATLKEGPIRLADGRAIAFIAAPGGDVRIELIQQPKR